METSESWLLDGEEYDFSYSLFLKLLFFVTGPMLILWPAYDLYRGKMDYAENEHIAALILILLGVVSLHAGWRSLGRITISKKGVTHTRLGMRTHINGSDIISIKNRTMLMSLKITGTMGVIFIEKQIEDYPLAYELLSDMAPDRLEPSASNVEALPVVTRTALNHYYFLIALGTGSVSVMVWQFWQYLSAESVVDYKVIGIAVAGLIFCAVFAALLYIKVEFTQNSIRIFRLFKSTEINKENIVHLRLIRSYENETDPAYDIEIEYTEMPVDEAPEDAEVYSQTIPGSLLDAPMEPMFDLVTREYRFDEEDE